MTILTAMALTMAILPGPAAGTDDAPTQEELEALERTLEEKRAEEEAARAARSALDAEIDDLRARMTSAAHAVQRHEAVVQDLEREVAEREHELDSRRQDLIANNSRLVRGLGALHRVVSTPSEALLALPGGAERTLQAALVLRSTVPRLQGMSARLMDEMDTLAATRQRVENRRQALQTALTALDEERVQMAALVDERRAIRDRFAERESALESEVARMVEQARDLRDLMARLDAERRAREASRVAAEARRLARARAAEEAAETRAEQQAQAERFRQQAHAPIALDGLAKVRGQLVMPAHGEVVREFGEGEGLHSQGLTLATGSGSQVVAPYDGKIAYAGPFRGYGLLLIVEHGDGYHSLLTGLDRLDVTTGQWVLAGEPVGVMALADESDHPELYVEIRRRGQPVDPVSWLAIDRG